MSNNYGANLFQLQTQQRLQDESARKQNDWEREKFYEQLALKRMDSERAEKEAEFNRQLKLAEMYGKVAGMKGEAAPTYKNPKIQEAADAHAAYAPAELEMLRAQQDIKQGWRQPAYEASMARVYAQQFGSTNRKVLDIESKEGIAASVLDWKNRYLQHLINKAAWEKDPTNPDNMRKKKEAEAQEGEYKKELATMLMRRAQIEGQMGASLEAVNPRGQQGRASKYGDAAMLLLTGTLPVEGAVKLIEGGKNDTSLGADPDEEAFRQR